MAPEVPLAVVAVSDFITVASAPLVWAHVHPGRIGESGVHLLAPSAKEPVGSSHGPGRRDGRRRLDDLARNGASRLTDGSDAIGAALTFAGAGGDRRYLVAVLNNAEMRDQGAVLQSVIAKFTGSRLSFARSGSVGPRPRPPAPTPLPPGTGAVFGPIRPTEVWQSVNATADFALSGQAMADMYRQATGQSVDGVIAIDVPGLAALLRVVGPVTAPGAPGAVDALNVGRVLLHDLYEGVPYAGDQAGRRERLGDVPRAVIDRLTTGSRCRGPGPGAG